MKRPKGEKFAHFLLVVTGRDLCYGSRMLKTIFNVRALLAGFAVLALGSTVRASDASALSLVKEANHYVSDEVKDHVVQIRSEKSIGSLTPIIWYVVFYDPDATFHATEVKFGGGRKLEVKRPMRALEFGRTDTKVMDMKKVKIDSDKAISIATDDPLLKGLTLKATQLWLERGDGDAPEWRVRLWAAKLRNPNDSADIGEIHIQANDGTITRRDLHINRVD